MAKYFCGLCEKKIGLLEDYLWLPDNIILCGKCHALHNKIVESMSDLESYKTSIEKFKQQFPDKEKQTKFVEHWNGLYEAKLQEAESNRIEEIKATIEEPKFSDYCVEQNIGPFENQDLVYTIDGVRGRHIDIYVDKVVITTKVTLGSLITHNSTDGEKTIYYSDCIGVQFKKSKFAIGYLQLETASSNGNNKSSNFFDENSFTFDTTVISNERMIEVADYVKSRIDAVKKGLAVPNVVNNSNLSVADELLKLKQLLDMGVLTREEFDAQKSKLLKP